MAVYDIEEARAKRASLTLDMGTEGWVADLRDYRSFNPYILQNVTLHITERPGGLFIGKALGLADFMPDCNWPLSRQEAILREAVRWGPPTYVGMTARDYIHSVK